MAVIQAWSSLTDQLQPAGPVTDRLSVPPAAGNVNDDGETVVGAAGQPEACDTATELPPMATVPSRAPPGFSPAWIRTESPPDTLDGVGVSHPWSALTDQLQSLRPVTLTYRTLVSLLRKACSAEFLPEAAGASEGQRTGRSVRRMAVTATVAGEPETRGFMEPACL